MLCTFAAMMLHVIEVIIWFSMHDKYEKKKKMLTKTSLPSVDDEIEAHPSRRRRLVLP